MNIQKQCCLSSFSKLLVWCKLFYWKFNQKIWIELKDMKIVLHKAYSIEITANRIEDLFELELILRYLRSFTLSKKKEKTFFTLLLTHWTVKNKILRKNNISLSYLRRRTEERLSNYLPTHIHLYTPSLTNRKNGVDHVDKKYIMWWDVHCTN